MRIVCIAVFALIFCRCVPRETPEIVSGRTQKHVLSIDALREREYAPSPVVIEKMISESEEYITYIVSYMSEGLKLYALMNTPRGGDGGYPLMIINHGYIPPDEYSTTRSYRTISDRYAKNGFLVLKPDYRGHDESEGRGEGPLRTIHYSIDVLNLIASAVSIDEWDSEHLFLYGHSMGGEVTLRVAEVAAGITAFSLWAPVSALIPENTLYFIRRDSYKNSESHLTALHKITSRSDYPDLSPVEHTAFITSPVVLHHGTDDESVPFDWSLNLIEAFTETGVRFIFYRHPGDNHNLSRYDYLGLIDKDIAYFKTLID
ncbi:MAG: alpha/beta hydrolase [Spirochaetales bacterium]|nr:alpha/beta hydrolase [Spirochaetales bacterium]